MKKSTRGYNSGKNKVLIVFYSRSGNTHEVANIIHQKARGDIIEIQTVDPSLVGRHLMQVLYCATAGCQTIGCIHD